MSFSTLLGDFLWQSAAESAKQSAQNVQEKVKSFVGTVSEKAKATATELNPERKHVTILANYKQTAAQMREKQEARKAAFAAGQKAENESEKGKLRELKAHISNLLDDVVAAIRSYEKARIPFWWNSARNAKIYERDALLRLCAAQSLAQLKQISDQLLHDQSLKDSFINNELWSRITLVVTEMPPTKQNDTIGQKL